MFKRDLICSRLQQAVKLNRVLGLGWNEKVKPRHAGCRSGRVSYNGFSGVPMWQFLRWSKNKSPGYPTGSDRACGGKEHRTNYILQCITGIGIKILLPNESCVNVFIRPYFQDENTSIFGHTWIVKRLTRYPFFRAYKYAFIDRPHRPSGSLQNEIDTFST